MGIGTRLMNLWNHLRTGPDRRGADPSLEGLGRRGELAAVAYLKSSGWTVVEHGSRTRFSELDIVAADRRTVVFVEVKTRTSAAAGLPIEAVDLAKQRRLARAALAYLKRHELLEQQCRFDVIAIEWPPGSTTPSIHHIRNAFEPPGQGNLFA
ncbi:MAG TPA: YraN family protein [Pirellulaceae bacterium]